MAETAYELLALGLRYLFAVLIALTLLRAAWLMHGDHREYKRMLRHLPDAGLIGEVVELQGLQSQPLPREGLIGSGRNCDIRLPGIRRRELEFMFRPGLGVRLIPLHARQGALLDEEPLNKNAAYALHGTVLELRGKQLRFRLFAGLDLPDRAAIGLTEGMTDSFIPANEDPGLHAYPDPLPPAAPPQSAMEMTWQYAPLPEELLNPPAEPAEAPPSQREWRFRQGGANRHE